MGRKGKWFGAVKRVFSPESKDKKARRLRDKSGFGKSEHSNTSPSESFEISALPPPANLTHLEETKLVEAELKQSEQANPVAIATPPVVRVAAPLELCGKSREEAAAIKIQTTFRGYLARRALRALRGLVRLKSLIHGNSVKRQATTTLRCMQTLARVQSQIRSRRIRMSEENQALQRQLLLKRENELENLKMGDEWDDSLQSKEQIEAGLTSKQEAGIRRERALAYAFSHQWKNNSRSANPLFMDPTNPHWGWSWLERWMATTTDKDDRSSLKSASFNTGAEITDAYARRDTNSEIPSPTPQKPGKPPVRHSPSTPPSKGKVVKSASPRVGWVPPEDDSRSVVSMQSDRNRKHSIGGSSVRDDESLASSSPFVPSYMIPTESARAKSRFQNIETVSDKGSVAPVKKRLSFPVGEKQRIGSPARRHSGPPKMDIPSVAVQL